MLHIAQTNGPPPLPDSLSDACLDFLRLCFNRCQFPALLTQHARTARRVPTMTVIICCAVLNFWAQLYLLTGAPT